MASEKNLINIGLVERQTGIGKDTLRVWERRYGFPIPLRDEHEERVYPEDQVNRLCLIKRLLDVGMRPAKVVNLALAELNALLQGVPKVETASSNELQVFMSLIKAHKATELRLALSRALLGQGLNEFLSKTVGPLNQLVGNDWMRGEIRVFEEHLYSEQVIHVLRTALGTIRDPSGTPRVLLTTLPGEEHALGLIMAEATLSLHGSYCIALGVQTPVQDIVLAADAHNVDVVVLSFSIAMPANQIKLGLEQVRNALPESTAIWVGGAGIARQRSVPEGVQVMAAMADLVEAVSQWHIKLKS